MIKYTTFYFEKIKNRKFIIYNIKKILVLEKLLGFCQAKEDK